MSAVAAPMCSPDQIAWSEPPPDLAAAEFFQVYILQNVSATSCSLQGVAQVSQSDSAGHQFIEDLASQSPAGLAELAPGAQASFYIGLSRCAVVDTSYGSSPTVMTVWILHTGIKAVFSMPIGPSCATVTAQTSPVVVGIISVPGWELGGSPPQSLPGANTGPPKTTLPSPPGNLPVSTTQP